MNQSSHKRSLDDSIGISNLRDFLDHTCRPRCVQSLLEKPLDFNRLSSAKLNLRLVAVVADVSDIKKRHMELDLPYATVNIIG